MNPQILHSQPFSQDSEKVIFKINVYSIQVLFLLVLIIAPNNIIYDNACNLHNYSLNREPDFLKTTWFLVDRFHWKNHAGYIVDASFSHWLSAICFIYTGCSVGYNMSLYPQFTEINSQIVEQCNSVLKRTKSSLSYMTKNNFLDHCKFMLWYRNTMQKPYHTVENIVDKLDLS